MFSSSHLLDSTGFMPQFVGQLETISTKQVPLLSVCHFNPLSRAFFALRTFAGVLTAWRVTKNAPGSCASSSVILRGLPMTGTSRPYGVVDVFCVTRVVGAIWPPVMP